MVLVLFGPPPPPPPAPQGLGFVVWGLGFRALRFVEILGAVILQMLWKGFRLCFVRQDKKPSTSKGRFRVLRYSLGMRGPFLEPRLLP